MRIRQLRCFVVLAEELNFTRAARRLNMSQPPLSTQIQALEREVGAELFTRTSRKVALTLAGTALVLHARSILAQYDRSMLEIREIAAGRSGVLEIGATGSILRGGLADLMAQFRLRHPRITLRVHEQSPATQITEVIAHRTDVSFNRSPARDDELSFELAWREEMVALLPRNHRLAEQSSVAIEDLRHDDHVVLNPDSSEFATHIMSFLVAAGCRPKVSQQVVDAQSIPSLIVAGFGVSIVPSSIAQLTSGPLVFRSIRPNPPVSDVFMVYRRHDQGPTLKTFLHTMRDILRDRGQNHRFAHDMA